MSLFQKRHYEKVAKDLMPCLIQEVNIEQWSRISVRLADMFQDDNDKFNRSLFLRACDEALRQWNGYV